MAWIIGGIVVGILVIWFFRAASRLSKHQALTTALGTQVNLSLKWASPTPFEIDDRLWSDRYILGFIQGIVALGVKFYGGRMSAEQKGMVLIGILESLRPDDWREICEDINHLTIAQDDDFAFGTEHAANVLGLVNQKLRPEFMADPDIQQAMAEVPDSEQIAEALFGFDKSREDSSYATAGMNLLMIYMTRHKKRLHPAGGF